MSSILVVEDEKIIRQAVKRLLERQGYDISEADSLDAAKEHTFSDYDLIISDLRMPGGNGTELIELAGDVPVLIMTSYASLKSAVDAMKLGAVDYIAKPFDHEEMVMSVERILKERNLSRSNEVLQNEVEKEYPVTGIVGSCEPMQALFNKISKVAPTDATVLIQGESGTGKELVARALHSQSTRRGAPMISVNCAAIPETLIESELFGHEKGAFTGAVARRLGKFEEANGGTLLLDEISEMDPRLQAKLLRAIQEREIDRIGSSKPVKIDVRILATSNRIMEDAVAQGNFREDLYFRLNVVNLMLPPLKDRPKDTPVLAKHFIKKYAEANDVAPLPLSPEAEQALQAHSWPGNVRELENIMHRAVLMAQGDTIGPEAIMISGQAVSSQAANDSQAVTGATDADGRPTRELVGKTVADVERDLIIDTLQHCLGNRTHAATILGISIRTLRNKLKQYSIEGHTVPSPGVGGDRPAA